MHRSLLLLIVVLVAGVFSTCIDIEEMKKMVAGFSTEAQEAAKNLKGQCEGLISKGMEALSPTAKAELEKMRAMIHH